VTDLLVTFTPNFCPQLWAWSGLIFWHGPGILDLALPRGQTFVLDFDLGVEYLGLDQGCGQNIEAEDTE